MRSLRLAALLVSSVCFAQTSQPPATADEVKYLRFEECGTHCCERSEEELTTVNSGRCLTPCVSEEFRGLR